MEIIVSCLAMLSAWLGVSPGQKWCLVMAILCPMFSAGGAKPGGGRGVDWS